MKFQNIVLIVFLPLTVFSACGPNDPSMLTRLNDDADFVQGRSEPETLFDEGAGPWNSKEATPRMKSRRNLALTFCKTLAPEFFGPDAAATLQHYLENSGTDYALDVGRMINETKSVNDALEAELERARKFVMTLPPGTYQLSSKQSQAGMISNEDNRNWYLAVAGYRSWSYVNVEIVDDARGNRKVTGDVEFFVRDRYNWDKGTSFNLGPITVTGEEMGDYHLMGLAQEYTSEGSYRTQISL